MATIGLYRYSGFARSIKDSTLFFELLKESSDYEQPDEAESVNVAK